MASSDVSRLDTVAARHSGTGPQNVHSARGEQFNNTISGGSGNTQYIDQSFHIPSGPSPEELDLEFRRRLFVTDPMIDRANLIDIKGASVPKTCEWIQKTNEYTSWHDEHTRRPLWIWGGPGKGKTMLSIFLSQELETEAKSLYFFCSADDGKRNTAVAVLRGLLWHLTTLFPKLTRAFRERFESNFEAAMSSREILWTTLSGVIGSVDCDRLYCIIDGLDECEENSRRWLANKLMSMHSGSSAKKIKLAIFSRELFELRDSLQVKLNTDHHENVNWAVEAFSNVRSEELFLRITCSDKIQARIKATLVDKAGGTFLWISFAVTELMKQENVSRVLDLLEELPAGLSPYYGRMVQNIDAHEREDGLRVLGCVTHASRPLDLMELATVVGCTPREGITPCENIRGLIAGYGPLLHGAKQTELGPVSLVHESLRDYVNKGDFPAGVRMSSEDIHARIARRCLDSLCNPGSPLWEYAQIFWPQHARASGKHAKGLLSHPSSFFHNNLELRNEWWQLTLRPQIYDCWTKRIPDKRLSPAMGLCYANISRLHMACSIGFKPWVDDILEKHNSWLSKRFYLQRRDSMGHTPIVHAVAEGYIEIVDALLQYTSAPKSLVNSTGGYERSLLHYASMYDQLEVAKLLLLRKANVNAKDDGGLTALHCAENEAMIRLLIDYGANVKAKSHTNSTLLQWARTEAVAMILIKHGAEVDAKDDEGNTALHLQASFGELATARLLISCGANAKSTNKLGETTLHRATMKVDGVSDGREAMVKLLVDNGADVNAREQYMHKTALYNAARAGHGRIAKILLDHGADVNGRDRKGWAALHSAAVNGHESTVRLLLDHGADINGRDREGRTALHVAVDSRHRNAYQATIRLLLDRGADFNARCSMARTSHYLAALKGDKATMKISLEHGADVDGTDSRK